MNTRLKRVAGMGLYSGIAATAWLLAVAAAYAQEAPPPAKPPEAAIEQIDSPQVLVSWLDPDNYPRVERAVNIMNARTTRARALNFLVDHRTYQPLQTNSFHDGLGFDAFTITREFNL